ncbi:MAG TPA: MOSC domain-containing protein [Bryobacteraceae bacterium]|nr:MOSC domain-containing protein [Bryobacteraceae bacterium]
MVYQLDSYRHWERQLHRNDFVFGQFGENLTVEGLPDDEVCIGDRYRIGNAIFEITQPRVTCYRVGIRMNEPQMAALLVSHRRPGFYFRVIQEGAIGAGDEILKIDERRGVCDRRRYRRSALSSGSSSRANGPVARLRSDIQRAIQNGNPTENELATLQKALGTLREARTAKEQGRQVDRQHVENALTDAERVFQSNSFRPADRQAVQRRKASRV